MSEPNSKSNESFLDDLKSLIPGYGAYKALESRREDDRLTRSYLVKRIDQCKSLLDGIGAQAVKSGDLETPLQTEKLRTELDRARSRLAAAVEGYSGWFSKRTVNEELLSQVAELDASLVSVIDIAEKSLQQELSDLSQVASNLTLLHQRIDRRSDLLKNA